MDFIQNIPSYNINIYQGSSKSWNLQFVEDILDEDDLTVVNFIPFDLSGFDSIFCEIKQFREIKLKNIIKLTLDDGLEIIGLDNNILTITINSERSKRLPVGKIFGDIRYSKNGNVSSLLKLNIRCESSVTNF